MKVTHLSTFDTGAGAAIAAYRVHNGLRLNGIDSRMYVLSRTSDDPTVQAFRPPMDPLNRLQRRWRTEQIRRDLAHYKRSKPDGYDMFSDDRSIHGGLPLRDMPRADLVALHWTAGFVDYQQFLGTIGTEIPLVWRLADMNPLTGGCHYAHECHGFTRQCGQCPQLGSSDLHDLSHQIWMRKRGVLASIPAERLHIVATSRWVEREARRSSLFGAYDVTVIPNALNTEDFAPRDRALARDTLGIAPEARVVVFVADRVTNRRKGFQFLLDALAGLEGNNELVLLSLGKGAPSVQGKARHIHLGYIASDRLRSLIYSAADVFVIPSLQEAFGQTVIESMACGTPVVGFDTGGIPDMVRPEYTGLLAAPEDVGGMRNAIARLLNDQALRRTMSHNCRTVALAEYGQALQAERYTRLFEQHIEQYQIHHVQQPNHHRVESHAGLQ